MKLKDASFLIRIHSFLMSNNKVRSTLTDMINNQKQFYKRKNNISCQLLGSTIKQHINMHLAFLLISFHKNFKYKYLVRTAES